MNLRCACQMNKIFINGHLVDMPWIMVDTAKDGSDRTAKASICKDEEGNIKITTLTPKQERINSLSQILLERFS